MPLIKQDRISFSKAIASADADKAAIDRSKAQVEIQKNKFFDLDQGNKRIIDGKNLLINPYEIEIARYDGLVRQQVTEQSLQDSSLLVVGNSFYPNEASNPPPSTAPNLWTKTKPYARTRAVGKQNNEAFPVAISAEQSKILDALNAIAEIETNYSLIQRVSGQYCDPVPPGIISYPALVTVTNSLISIITDLSTYLPITQSGIPTNDPVSARQAQNNAAISNISSALPALTSWLTLATFNSAHGQTNCAGFTSYNPALLGPTKLQSGNLTALKTALQNRQTFVNTRVGQISNNLGTIIQDLNTGNTTGSGLYFERFGAIVLRISLLGGSLISYNGMSRSISAQEDQKSQIDTAKNTYSGLLTVGILSASANGTKLIHLKSSVGFLPGDSIYLVSETQEEISRSVISVSGNSITLNQEVPAKYRSEELARIYKDIS